MNGRNNIRTSFLESTSWALGVVFGAICGLAVVAGERIGQFLAMTEHHRTMCLALVFLAIFFTLCILALYSFYFLFFVLGAP